MRISSSDGQRILLQEGHRGHDQAGRTVAALDCLLIDESPLHRMQPIQRAQPLQGDDGRADDFTYGDAAGGQRLPVDQDLAGAALFESAGQLGGLQAQVIAQDVDQRRGRVNAQRMVLPIDAQAYSRQLW